MLSKLATLKSYVFTFIVLTFFTISSLSAFDISKNASKGNFEVTSWKAGGGYSVITSAGFVDGYGKVYLTHKFKANSGEALSGDFTGAARAISKDGDMAFASLQGIWKREGKTLTIHTLDSLTDGTANYAKGTFDLYEGTLKFDVFSIE